MAYLLGTHRSLVSHVDWLLKDFEGEARTRTMTRQS